MVLINCEETDLIESLLRSFSRSKRSDLTHCTHISILISVIEMLPIGIASCKLIPVHD